MKLLFLYLLLFIPPMVFINYKLFTVARNNRISPEMTKSLSLKNISSCLLVVVCLILMCIPSLVYIGLRQTSKKTELTLDTANLAGLWAGTVAIMNSTFNCLILYWKNKTLRAEGMKIIKSMKICQRGQS